jgi:putative cardiolipin synthase
MTLGTRLLTLILVLLIGGCAGLPPRGPVEPSQAYTDTDDTALARIAAASRPADAAGASGFRLLPTGEFAFTARTALAEQAQRSLDAQYYHIHTDPAGQTFLRELRDAALRGVRVRLLVDDFHSADLYESLVGLAAHPNVQVRLFNPLPVRAGSPLMRMALSWNDFDRVNHRMHNKLFVADNAVAVYGGRNVADEYFMRHGAANFIDLDVLSTGPVVRELSKAFDRYWNSEQVYPLHAVLPVPADPAQARADFDRRVRSVDLGQVRHPPTDPLDQTSVPAQLAEGRLKLSYGSADVFADPPDKVDASLALREPTAAMRGQLDIIAHAKSEVAIVSPYFVPSDIGMRMMGEAAKRGGRAIILTNSLGSTDEPLAHDAYSRYRVEMLRLGMELYELSPDLSRLTGNFGTFGKSIGRLHVKAAAVDQRWLLVGSVNLDARSAVVNTEMAVAIDCPPIVKQAMGLIAGDGYRSMYKLRLREDGRTIEWLQTDEQGRTTATTDEPHNGWLLRLKLWFQSIFVDENML